MRHIYGAPVYISYYGDGKPYVVDEQLFVSISHTYKDIVIAFSKKPVGVDIEYKKSRHYQSISAKMPDGDVRDIDEFYKKWTQYEAQFKHGGDEGVFGYFDVFENTQMTVFSEDTDYKFVQMETFMH